MKLNKNSYFILGTIALFVGIIAFQNIQTMQREAMKPPPPDSLEVDSTANNPPL